MSSEPVQDYGGLARSIARLDQAFDRLSQEVGRVSQTAADLHRMAQITASIFESAAHEGQNDSLPRRPGLKTST